jgi:hypothetical protein
MGALVIPSSMGKSKKHGWIRCRAPSLGLTENFILQLYGWLVQLQAPEIPFFQSRQ